jgi:hypothetical protein
MRRMRVFVLMIVCVFVIMIPRVLIMMLVVVVMMIVFVLVMFASVLPVSVLSTVIIVRRSLFPVPCSLPFAFFRQHVHLGRRQSAAHHRACFQARAHAQRGCRLRHSLKRDTGIDQRAQQHIAADAGKALKVSNSHRVVIVNCRRKGGRKRGNRWGKTWQWLGKRIRHRVWPVLQPAESRSQVFRSLSLIESRCNRASHIDSLRASAPP